MLKFYSNAARERIYCDAGGDLTAVTDGHSILVFNICAADRLVGSVYWTSPKSLCFYKEVELTSYELFAIIGAPEIPKNRENGKWHIAHEIIKSINTY